MGRQVAVSYTMIKETANGKDLRPEITRHVYRTPRRQCGLREVTEKE